MSTINQVRESDMKRVGLDSEESHVPTQGQLEEWVREWAGRLRIHDWSFDIVMLRRNDIDSLGACRFTLSKQRASIKVLDPNDQSPDEDPIDIEQVIVHELLHVRLACLDDKIRPPHGDRRDWVVSQFEYDVCMEQPIEAISWALVTLKREAEKDNAR